MGTVEFLYFLPLSGSRAPGSSKAQNMSVLRCFKTPNSRGRGAEGGGRGGGGGRRRDKGKTKGNGRRVRNPHRDEEYMYTQTRQRGPTGSVDL